MIIKPSAELRNNYRKVADFCIKSNEPVFLTNNGEGELVVMSNTYGIPDGVVLYCKPVFVLKYGPKPVVRGQTGAKGEKELKNDSLPGCQRCSETTCF